MKIVLLTLLFPVIILAQTEFYLSTARAPYFNDCNPLKDSLPVWCELTENVTIRANIWNPDSLAWCTKEG